MREQFGILLVAVIASLGICGLASRRSYKAIAPYVSLLIFSCIPPVTGNFLIIWTGNYNTALMGYYIYFIGMDLLLFANLQFTFNYCYIKKNVAKINTVVTIILLADVAQLVLNRFLGHAFDIEAVPVDGYDYYRLIPHLGQAVHRVIDYTLLLASVIIFIHKIIKSSKIYSERYSVILVSMVGTGLLQTFYIFSRTPVDISMAFYGIFGFLVFMFSLYYRPMRVLDRMLAQLASDMPESLFVLDAFGKCIWANDRAIELAGITDDKFDRATDDLVKLFGEYDLEGSEWKAMHVLDSGDSRSYYEFTKMTITDEKGHETGAFLTIRDVTEEQTAIERERYSATHDSMTGLFTRDHIYSEIDRMTAASEADGYIAIFLDIKNFRLINDIYGDEFGNLVLKSVSKNIREIFPTDSLCAWLSGGNFGLFLKKEVFDPEMAEKDLSEFMVYDGTADRKVLIHFGVYEIAGGESGAAQIFDRAHMALSGISGQYRIHVAYYDENMRNRALRDQQLTARLDEALEERQIRPYLQPIVDADGKIVGAEALARWIHPEEGFLSPDSFIPVFERTGLIVEVDRYMWCCACEILSRWKKEGIDLFLSVNISPKDFYFMDISEELKKLTDEFGIPSSSLRIEITETVMMTDPESKMDIITKLRDLGFLVEMDDFGNGFSSLNLLKDMPVDILKIDMNFLQMSDKNGKARTILQNIINLSDDLGIISLTEGVETDEQHKMLSDMGCRMFQGYYFSRPVPVEQFETDFARGAT